MTTEVSGFRTTGSRAQAQPPEPLRGATACLIALTMHVSASQPVTNDALPLRNAALQ